MRRCGSPMCGGWRRWASSLAASRMISTTCSRPCRAAPRCSSTARTTRARCGGSRSCWPRRPRAARRSRAGCSPSPGAGSCAPRRWTRPCCSNRCGRCWRTRSGRRWRCASRALAHPLAACRRCSPTSRSWRRCWSTSPPTRATPWVRAAARSPSRPRSSGSGRAARPRRARTSGSTWRIPARACRRRCWRAPQSHSSPPSRRARGPGWGWPWRRASPSRAAAASGFRAGPARAPP